MSEQNIKDMSIGQFLAWVLETTDKAAQHRAEGMLAQAERKGIVSSTQWQAGYVTPTFSESEKQRFFDCEKSAARDRLAGALVALSIPDGWNALQRAVTPTRWCCE